MRIAGLLVLSGHLASLQQLDAVEYFAGVENVVRAFTEIGLAAYGFELKKDTIAMDLLSAPGFLFAISLGLRTLRGGFSLFAPVCSTWVWVSRHSTGRSYMNPMGNVHQACTADANKMISRVVLMASLLISRGCWVVIEQPVSSLMQYRVKL